MLLESGCIVKGHCRAVVEIVLLCQSLLAWGTENSISAAATEPMAVAIPPTVDGTNAATPGRRALLIATSTAPDRCCR